MDSYSICMSTITPAVIESRLNSVSNGKFTSWLSLELTELSIEMYLHFANLPTAVLLFFAETQCFTLCVVLTDTNT